MVDIQNDWWYFTCKMQDVFSDHTYAQIGYNVLGLNEKYNIYTGKGRPPQPNYYTTQAKFVSVWNIGLTRRKCSSSAKVHFLIES